MCKCLEMIARFVVGILSFIFAIIGLVLMAFGIMVQTKSTVLQNLFTTLLDLVKQQAETATGSSVSIDNFNVADLVGSLALVFIILGVVMLLLGVFGVAGACCMVKFMIVLYFIVLLIFLISQIALVAIVIANRGMITDPPKATLETQLKTDYAGVNGTDVTSLLWNVLMNGLQCCGIHDYNDFDQAPKWKNVWGVGTTANFITPAACCKTGQFTSSTASCARAPTDSTNNWKTGCYEKLWDFIFKGTTFIIFASVDIGGFGLLTFFSGVIIYQISNKNKVDIA